MEKEARQKQIAQDAKAAPYNPNLDRSKKSAKSNKTEQEDEYYDEEEEDSQEEELKQDPEPARNIKQQKQRE